MSASVVRFVSICLVAFLMHKPFETVRAGESIARKLGADMQWTESGSNLCGLYSVARAMQLLGFSTSPKDLWDTRYVGSSLGSTPHELVRAIEDRGAHALIASNLSCFDLQAVGSPVIASIRDNVDRKVYNHWVCVVGDGDGIVVYDGPTSCKVISHDEFLAKWNGVGILVSKNKYLWWSVLALRLIAFGVFVVMGLLFLSAWSQRSRTSSLIPQYARLLVTTVLIARVVIPGVRVSMRNLSTKVSCFLCKSAIEAFQFGMQSIPE